MEWRLRLYRIEEGRMEDWLTEWREQVRPLRAQHGFLLGGAWVADEASTFVWLLGYDGDWEQADRAYYASAERAAIDPNPARLIAEPAEWPVRPV